MSTLKTIFFSALSMMVLCTAFSSCTESDSEGGGDIIGTWYHVKDVYIDEDGNSYLEECSEDDGDCYMTITKKQIKIHCRNDFASGSAVDYERKGKIIRAFGMDWYEIKSVSSSSLVLKSCSDYGDEEQILYYKK